jgi:uncharacterized membrane protein YfcA
MLLMDLTAAAVMGRAARQHVNWEELKPLLPGSVVGVVAGATLLLSLAKEPLLTALGLFVLAFAIRSMLNLHGEKPISRIWALPASLAGGTVSALFGTGGPPYVIYLTHRICDKTVFRATTSLLFLLEGGLRAVVFAVAGLLLQPDLLSTYLAGLPLMGIGIWLGSRVHVGISNEQMTRLVGLLLLISGTSLLWKAWH